MTFFTLSGRFRCLGLLAGLFLTLTAGAQPAPGWVSATAVGASHFYVAAAVDAAGNTYEVENFEGTAVVGSTTLTSQGSLDGYLVKYTPAGAVAWVRHLGSAGSDAMQGLAVDAAGNVYVTGFFKGSIALGNNLSLNGGSPAGAYSKAFLVRYSPQGLPEWAQQSTPTPSASGSGVGLDAAGNVYLAGLFDQSVTIGTHTVPAAGMSRTNTFLARFSAATGAVHSLVRTFYYAPPAGGSSWYSPRLAVAPTGEAYLFNAYNLNATFDTQTLTSRGANDVLVAKYNAQGAFEWVQQFGGAGAEQVYGGRVDAAGNLYVAAAFTGPATFGTTALPGAGSTDGCLVKYSPQGSLLWVQTVGGPGADITGGLCLDAAGNPYVVSSFTGVAQCGPTTLTSAGLRDFVVAAYTPQGQLRWTQQAGGPDDNTGFAINPDGSGNLHILGRSAGPCAFGSLTLSNPGTLTFLATLNNSALSTRAPRARLLPCYPNPGTDEVRLAGLAAGTPVRLLDALGRVVRECPVSASSTVSVRGLAPGRYILRATDYNGQLFTGPLTVE